MYKIEKSVTSNLNLAITNLCFLTIKLVEFMNKDFKSTRPFLDELKGMDKAIVQIWKSMADKGLITKC
jgi:hypothetical protein